MEFLAVHQKNFMWFGNWCSLREREWILGMVFLGIASNKTSNEVFLGSETNTNLTETRFFGICSSKIRKFKNLKTGILLNFPKKILKSRKFNLYSIKFVWILRKDAWQMIQNVIKSNFYLLMKTKRGSWKYHPNKILWKLLKAGWVT